jgi:hypoxia up-regulated 1
VKSAKTKKVLSANDAIPVFIESVHKDVDLSGYRISRKDFENMSEDLLSRVGSPIEQALSDANLTKEDIDLVEIIGGGVRVPKVQSLLREHLDIQTLSVHLNGDEAMALGSAFRAANLSKAFKVRYVGVSDVNPWSVGVRIQGPSEFSKSAVLFPERTVKGSKKMVAFGYDDDFLVNLMYEDEDKIPEGSSRLIRTYQVSGLKEIASDEKWKDMLSGPKVQLAFRLDEQGLVSLEKADVLYEEEIEIEVEEEVELEEEDVTDEEKNDANAVEENEESVEEENEENVEEKKDNDDEDPTKKDDNSDDEDSTNTDDNSDDNEDKKKLKKKKTKTITVTKTITKKHRNKLKVTDFTSVALPENAIEHLNKEQLERSKKMVQNLNTRDAERREHGAMLNALESYVYESRDFLREKADKVTTEETRDSLLQELTDIEDWLFDVDLSTPLEEIKSKHDDMMKKITSIRRKFAETTARPAAVKALREALEAVSTHVNTWSEKRPQIEEDEKNDVETRVEELKEWLESKVKEQSELSDVEEPVFTSQDVAGKVKKLNRMLNRLLRRPKLKSVYLEAPDPEADKKKQEEEEKLKTKKTKKKKKTKEAEEGKSTKEEEEEEEPKKEEKEEL